MNIKDIVGQRFGKLVVISYVGSKLVGKKRPINKRFYKVKCDCGKEKEVCRENLVAGICKSCGCTKIEKTISRNKLLRLPNNTSLWKRHYRGHIKNAQNRNIINELSFERFKEICQKNCFYCGQKPSGKTCKNLYGEIFKNGIDRIDSNKGYIEDNSRSCCPMCNNMKSYYTEKEFLTKIKDIFKENFPMTSKALNI